MTEYEMPAYQVGLRTSCRLLPNGETVYGLAWEINRRLPEREGEWPNFETLMVSKDVFEFEDDAKRDAVRTIGGRIRPWATGRRRRCSPPDL